MLKAGHKCAIQYQIKQVNSLIRITKNKILHFFQFLDHVPFLAEDISLHLRPSKFTHRTNKDIKKLKKGYIFVRGLPVS